MLQSIGPKFCETIMDYHQLEPVKLKQIVEELDKIANNQATADAKEKSLNMEDDPGAAMQGQVGNGLSKEAVLGIIQDEDSCQDSDFSGDDDKVPTNNMEAGPNEYGKYP